MGCEVVILERQAEFPARSLATQTLLGDWDDLDSLREVASLVDGIQESRTKDRKLRAEVRTKYRF